MPDTILSRNGICYKVPSWYPHAGSTHDQGSFTDHYNRRLDEFRMMSREELKAEVTRLRDLHKQQGRRYTVSIRAQTYAAEDVYRKRFYSSQRSSAYPWDAHDVRKYQNPQESERDSIPYSPELGFIKEARQVMRGMAGTRHQHQET